MRQNVVGPVLRYWLSLPALPPAGPEPDRPARQNYPSALLLATLLSTTQTKRVIRPYLAIDAAFPAL